MNGDLRRWVLMIASVIALAIIVATPLVMISQLMAQNDKLEEQQRVQSALIVANRKLVADLEDQRAVDDAIAANAAFDTCQKTNYALRANREAIAAAEQALIDVLRMSPHSATVADQVAASLPPLPTAEQSESDCDGDGVLTDADYATP